MATTDPITPSTRKAIATQTDDFLGALARSKTRGAATRGTRDATPAEAPANAKLAETFAYCVVSLSTVENPPEELTSLLQPNGSWLSTVVEGKKVTHYSLSESGALDPDHHEMVSLVKGPLGQKIDDAIDWVEANFKEDAVVRILAFPAYHVHAFGILQDRKAFAVLVDPTDPERTGKLVPEKKYPLKDFLTELAKLPHS